MSSSHHYLLFNLGEQLFALRLHAVERVIRAVEVTPLPRAPEIVLGVINLHGRVVPVFNARVRFGLPERELDLGNQIIIARAREREVALVVDEVRGVRESSDAEVIAADEILPGLKHVTGVALLGDDLIFIHDLDRFLSLEEGKELEAVLENSYG